MPDQVILALDQGTSSSRAIIFNRVGRPVRSYCQEFPQHYPKPGWVEHNPDDIWNSQVAAARNVSSASDISRDNIAAVGITNQRETTIVWDRRTGEAICYAIVWQDRRTADYCDFLRREGWDEEVRSRTGLVVDPYFSATKLRWILENIDGARRLAESGNVLFGTVDTFLIWRLTDGRVHITDYSNASRTMLFNIHTLTWDEDLLREFDIPSQMLPDVRPSSEIYGEITSLFDAPIPIAGDAGDQQAATFGQACFSPGMVKNTYGTGNFMLMNIGAEPRRSDHGLLTTIAWGLDGEITYALEGGVFVTGAAVQWLRDEVRLIDSAARTEELALSVPDSGGVYVVPAFTGLGTPYWDPYARGAIVGLTRGSGRTHLVRAVLESAAYQSHDVLRTMLADSGRPVPIIRVDGGMVANNFLMQFQADISGARVERPAVTETTALGAAFLAGLAVGYWDNQLQIADTREVERIFEPEMSVARRDTLYKGWQRAVERASRWVEES